MKCPSCGEDQEKHASTWELCRRGRLARESLIRVRDYLQSYEGTSIPNYIIFNIMEIISEVVVVPGVWSQGEMRRAVRGSLKRLETMSAKAREKRVRENIRALKSRRMVAPKT